MLVTFHFDPVCPWTWLTSRWLVRVAETGAVEVRWAPFSLAHLNEGQELPERFASMMEASRAGTRIIHRLANEGDHAGIARFYDAWGDATFRTGTDPGPEVIGAALRAAGLDGGIWAAADDHSLDAAVDAATDAATALAGPDIGSPVLTWTDPEHGDQAIFGPIVDAVPGPDDSVALWDAVRTLTALGSFKELKRGRQDPPELLTS